MSDDFNFWQDHSERFLIMAHLYDRNYKMDDADSVASKTGVCGDSITIYLKFGDEGQSIEKFSYELHGCKHTNACCNVLAERVEGKSVEACWDITPEDIITELETMPEDHYHCAELAVGTFYLALSRKG